MYCIIDNLFLLEEIMKFVAFNVREDERRYFEEWSKETGIEVSLKKEEITPDNVSETVGYDAVIGLQTGLYPDNMFKELSDANIKVFSVRNVGVDNINLDDAKQNGVAVTNVPAYSPSAIAEFSVTQLLQLLRRLFPKFGVGREIAFFACEKSFGDGQHDFALFEFGNDMLRKPLHAEARYARNHRVCAGERGFELFDLIKFHALGERLIKFGVTIFFFAIFDDFRIEMRADKAHFVSVFRRRKGERRSHHARTYDCDDCHFIFSPAASVDCFR